LLAEHDLRHIMPDRFSHLPRLGYRDILFEEPKWIEAGNGLDFSRVRIYRGDEHVDTVAMLRVNPKQYTLRAVSGFSRDNLEMHTAEEWQQMTGAAAVVNAAQYMGGDMYGCPVAPMRADGRNIGPGANKNVRGMILAQPVAEGLPEISFLDINYDAEHFGLKRVACKGKSECWGIDTAALAKAKKYWNSYENMVQHWGMLLDREGRIRIRSSDWQANRTVTAMGNDRNFYIFNTEGGFFTLHYFGRLLRDANAKRYLNINTAMNMDGGYEADLVVRAPKLEYTAYGRFETYGPEHDASWPEGRKIRIPNVLCVVPKKNPVR